MTGMRQQIGSAYEAGQHGLYGLALRASHQSITARLERAWLRLQTLHAIGQEQEVRVLLVSDTLYEVCEEATCSENH